MSPFALLRAFRGETGLPPHAYLNQLRVRHARRLLDGGLAPAVVAAEAGFADQAHLTRHFKRVMGVPPGAYQRERGIRPAPTLRSRLTHGDVPPPQALAFISRPGLHTTISPTPAPRHVSLRRPPRHDQPTPSHTPRSARRTRLSP